MAIFECSRNDARLKPKRSDSNAFHDFKRKMLQCQLRNNILQDEVAGLKRRLNRNLEAGTKRFLRFKVKENEVLATKIADYSSFLLKHESLKETNKQQSARIELLTNKLKTNDDKNALQISRMRTQISSLEAQLEMQIEAEKKYRVLSNDLQKRIDEFENLYQSRTSELKDVKSELLETEKRLLYSVRGFARTVENSRIKDPTKPEQKPSNLCEHERAEDRNLLKRIAIIENRNRNLTARLGSLKALKNKAVKERIKELDFQLLVEKNKKLEESLNSLEENRNLLKKRLMGLDPPMSSLDDLFSEFENLRLNLDSFKKLLGKEKKISKNLREKLNKKIHETTEIKKHLSLLKKKTSTLEGIKSHLSKDNSLMQFKIDNLESLMKSYDAELELRTSSEKIKTLQANRISKLEKTTAKSRKLITKLRNINKKCYEILSRIFKNEGSDNSEEKFPDSPHSLDFSGFLKESSNHRNPNLEENSKTPEQPPVVETEGLKDIEKALNSLEGLYSDAEDRKEEDALESNRDGGYGKKDSCSDSYESNEMKASSDEPLGLVAEDFFYESEGKDKKDAEQKKNSQDCDEVIILD